MTTQNVTFELKRGLASQWLQPGIPILRPGEPGVELDTGQIKIGNGSTQWTGLTYVGYVSGGDGFTFSGPTGSILFYDGNSLKGVTGLVTNGENIILAGSVYGNGIGDVNVTGAGVTFNGLGDVTISSGLDGYLSIVTGNQGIMMDRVMINSTTGGVAIGMNAGINGQDDNTIAIGNYTSSVFQPEKSILLSVGDTTVDDVSASTGSIVLNTAGTSKIQAGINSIVLNTVTNPNTLPAPSNSIVLNTDASSVIRNAYRSSAFYATPVRVDTNQITPLAYNPDTGEIVQGSTFKGKTASIPYVNVNGGFTVSNEFTFTAADGMQVKRISDTVNAGSFISLNSGDITIFEGVNGGAPGNVRVGNNRDVIFGGDIVPNKSGLEIGSTASPFSGIHAQAIFDNNNDFGSTSGYVLSCANGGGLRWVAPSGSSAGSPDSIIYNNGSGLVGSTFFQYSPGNGITMDGLSIYSNSTSTEGLFIGYYSGAFPMPGQDGIIIGYNAGVTGQGQGGIAIGNNAGAGGQGNNSVAIGTNAGFTGQKQNTVAIGYNAGRAGLGNNSIAISTAGFDIFSVPTNTIVLNASGNGFNHQPTTNSFFVKPIRSESNQILQTKLQLFYNQITGEIFSE
jgi:hypothetical protein